MFALFSCRSSGEQRPIIIRSAVDSFQYILFVDGITESANAVIPKKGVGNVISVKVQNSRTPWLLVVLGKKWGAANDIHLVKEVRGGHTYDLEEFLLATDGRWGRILDLPFRENLRYLARFHCVEAPLSDRDALLFRQQEVSVGGTVEIGGLLPGTWLVAIFDQNRKRVVAHRILEVPENFQPFEISEYRWDELKRHDQGYANKLAARRMSPVQGAISEASENAH